MKADRPAVPHDRAAFPVWTEERVRFADTDMIGHVNHASIVTLFEIGRSSLAFRGESMQLFSPGLAAVVRVLTVDYLGELRYPATVQIGMRVTHTGRSSFEVEQILLSRERVVATAVVTYVLADLAAGCSTPLTDALRDHLVTLR